jgi:hypothetical protein
MADSRPAFFCVACMAYHVPPACNHDPTAPCFDCKAPRSYRFTLDDGSLSKPAWRCYRCALGLPKWTPPIEIAAVSIDNNGGKK